MTSSEEVIRKQERIDRLFRQLTPENQQKAVTYYLVLLEGGKCNLQPDPDSKD